MTTPVILCGGSGTRLWPLSRKALPKQFVPLVGDKSLLQLTLERAAALNPAQPQAVCVASEDHRFFVQEAMDRAGVAGAIVLEPVARGEIEMGVQQITEILPVNGAVLVGPLPPSLQKITTYSIMATVKAGDMAAASQLRKFLQTPEATAIFKRKGFMVDR